MRTRPDRSLRALVALPVLATIAQHASADIQNPGSLLVYPEFDNGPGVITILTVTNSNPTEAVRVEWIYYEADSCFEFNRTDLLTQNDKLSVLTSVHNPSHDRGYVVVHAKDIRSRALVFDHLIGTTLVLDGLDSFEYGVNPVAFRGIGDGIFTDVDADGRTDLDGVEYSFGPDELLFPRFFGQTDVRQSELLLIDMSGGRDFEAVANLLMFNDNEAQFSLQLAFSCWTRLPLQTISGAFDNVFLQTTDDDPDEVVGAPQVESGWLRVDGLITTSLDVAIVDPLVLGLLFERSGNRAAAGRPFHLGQQGAGSVNQAPVCTPDAATTVEGSAVDIDLLANDSDPEGALDCGSLAILTPPSDGTLILSGCAGVGCATCVATYVPNQGFFGVDGFSYVVSDAEGLSSGGCDVTIVVEELIEPPECPTGVSFELWPPNHQYHELDLGALAGVVDPNGLPLAIVITAITQDEVINGSGDGDTVCDGTGVGTNVASIRAERQGGGNGRVYRVSYTATNSAGASCDGSLDVTVPHSQNGQPAVDDGQLHDSTDGC